MKTFLVAGIGLAVFIEFLLISKKKKSISDQILTMWMFLVSLHLFLSYLFITGDIYDYPFLLGFEQPFALLHGVFLYLYVAFLTRQIPNNRMILFLHFLPAVIIYAYLISFFLLPPEQKIWVYRNYGAGYELFSTVRWYAIVCSGIFYVGWSMLLLRKHRLRIRDQFSDLEKVSLRWLRLLTFGMGGIWFIVIFFQNDFLVLNGMVIFVFLIGFLGVRQADIFSTSLPITEPTVEPGGESATEVDEQKKKYTKSGLTEDTSKRLHQTLRQLMTSEALYKKSDLSITDLASKLAVHPNYLSQVINQEEKKNFYDFVNTYRIEEFKRLIAIPTNQQFTLLSLAYDCGFSSKSSFNRYFKKATGQTPSEYFSALSKDEAKPD